MRSSLHFITSYPFAVLDVNQIFPSFGHIRYTFIDLLYLKPVFILLIKLV